MVQQDGVGEVGNRGTYKAWNVDGLLERMVGDGGAVTFEFAHYRYCTSGKTDVAGGFGGAGPFANVGALQAGDATMLSAAWLIGQKIGVGRLRPLARYQRFVPTADKGTEREVLAGVSYIIAKGKAQVALEYAESRYGGASKANRVTLGLRSRW